MIIMVMTLLLLLVPTTIKYAILYFSQLIKQIEYYQILMQTNLHKYKDAHPQINFRMVLVIGK